MTLIHYQCKELERNHSVQGRQQESYVSLLCFYLLRKPVYLFLERVSVKHILESRYNFHFVHRLPFCFGGVQRKCTFTLLFLRDDYLKISNDKDQTFGLFCRDRTGKVVLVTGASAVITFRSDFFLEKKGFQLFFTSVPIGKEYESR